MQKKIVIPFSPLPYPVLKQISERFLGIGSSLSKAFPYLKLDLKQAEMPISVEEYGAIMFVMFAIFFAFGTIMTGIMALKLVPEAAVFIAPTIGGIAALLIFIQLSVYPKIQVKKKVRDIERNLIFALRTMLVQLKSGVSLFDALNVIGDGDYGMVSKEIKKAVEEINTGTVEEEALQNMAMNNPSLFFRRALWQIVNGLKAGADITNVLAELVDSLGKEQSIQIRKYGASLKLLSLMYMMLGVIIPALGITFLIVLSSFPQIQINEWYFWGLLGFVGIGEFMYLGIIKSKRPNLMEAA